APSSDHGGEEIVSDLAVEMEDRFGPPPEHAARFVRVMRCKTQLRSLKALGCEAVQDRVTLHLRDDTPLDPQKLMKVVAKKGSPWRLTPDRRLTRRWEPGETRDGIDAVERLIGELQQHRKDDA
ncbi:MAG: TRCF domain-containing protein, partial [Polyangiales bacterium]